MNEKQITDLIERMRELGHIYSYQGAKNLIQEYEKLNKPEKVTIPQFVASWIEYCKFTHVNLQHALIVGDVYFYNYANQKDFSKLKEFLETENNQATFARAWLDGYEVEETKYVVTDGNHLYFKGYQEDVDIVILADEQPGTIEYVKKFDTKEEAQKAADILGWKVQEVEE
jgi:gp35 protein